MHSKIDEYKACLIITFIAFSLTCILIYWYLLDPQQFVNKRLGFSNHLLDFWAWIFTLLIALIYVLYTIMAVSFVKKHIWKCSILKVLGLWIAITSSITEEIVFRQLVIEKLYELEYTTWIQIIISGIIFGIAHGLWGLLGKEIKVIFPIILTTTILGILLAMLYIYTNNNIFYPIVSHTLINFFIEPWLLLAVISKRWHI
ncbi:CPBP family glutamic-type intramembrane protease [Staphylococcus pseudintermedius]|uniref:CPBP family glutamic-type intramembrane protease n=1 Tax=Staphylococcus pseudintermedius TaxID=283734 RepID=UPI0035BFFA92